MPPCRFRLRGLSDFSAVICPRSGTSNQPKRRIWPRTPQGSGIRIRRLAAKVTHRHVDGPQRPRFCGAPANLLPGPARAAPCTPRSAGGFSTKNYHPGRIDNFAHFCPGDVILTKERYPPFSSYLKPLTKSVSSRAAGRTHAKMRPCLPALHFSPSAFFGQLLFYPAESAPASSTNVATCRFQPPFPSNTILQ